MDLLLLELMKKRIMLLAIVHSCLYCKKVIDVIVIRNDRNTPYYLTEQYQGVFANNIYSRIMDTNTPKNASADIDVIEKLWKKRFGIDATALDRALLFLQKPYDWAINVIDKNLKKDRGLVTLVARFLCFIVFAFFLPVTITQISTHKIGLFLS